jgi:hypothetical protein
MQHFVVSFGVTVMTGVLMMSLTDVFDRGTNGKRAALIIFDTLTVLPIIRSLLINVTAHTHYPTIVKPPTYCIVQANQTLPWHHPIHLDQEQLFTGLLAFASVLGIVESHLLHRKTRRWSLGILPKSGSLLQSYPGESIALRSTVGNLKSAMVVG